MSQVQPLPVEAVIAVGIISRKRSRTDMTSLSTPSKVIDEDTYRARVLCLSQSLTEEEVDAQLAQEAQDLGLTLPQISSEVISGLASSLSATTIASDTRHHSSILSQSTAPTSCASSEFRPVIHSSGVSSKSPPQSSTPSIISEIDSRRGSTGSSLRNGFRKMTGFRKRKSVMLDTSAVNSIHSQIDRYPGNRSSIQSEVRSPVSLKSSKSSWSSPQSATKQSFEQTSPVDVDALQRTMESTELLALRSNQLREKDRFIQYQREVLGKLKSQHLAVRSDTVKDQQQVIHEVTKKNDKAIDDFEARQLEIEMKMIRDHEYDKKATLIRLRHMEAYCQSVTPPPAENSPDAKGKGPEVLQIRRKVTDKDYHNLAQVYRERDAMDVLHTSKINVLRGKQKRSVEGYTLKKEREVEAIERQHGKALEALDQEARREEGNLTLAFGMKRAQLETRWRLQATIERTKLEKASGLKYAAMPDVLASDDQS